MKFFQKRYVLILLLNIILFFCLYKNYSIASYYNDIILNNQPIKCVVIKVDCNTTESGSPYCNVNFKNMLYTKIELSQCDRTELGLNEELFYYDKSENKIINKTYDAKKVFIAYLILFLISLTIWFIPKNSIYFKD